RHTRSKRDWSSDVCSSDLSSQSIKRAVRECSYFENDLADNTGTRTKRLFERLKEKLLQDGVSEKDAQDTAEKVAKIFGKLEAPRSEERRVGKDERCRWTKW